MNIAPLLDVGIMIPVLGLMGISLSLIASTASSLFVNQLMFFLVGFAFFLVFSSFDIRIWKKLMWYVYGASLCILLISFLGPSVRGSTRWIDLGVFRLQPSELIKPLIILVLASLFGKDKKNNLRFHGLPLVVIVPVVLLIFKQPDLGNVLVYLFTFVTMEMMSGLPFLYFLTGVFSFGIFIPVIWFILKEYQRSRLLTFLNPNSDPIGAGYNALQAMIAIGSGQLLGLGLGRGTQSHLLFLPEYHTDFVFASIGEELGFLGAAVVIVFYFILLGKILLVALRTEDTFGKLLCFGCFSQLFIQVFINIGMNIGLLPITGITLPLLSYGGSSIVSTFIDLAIVTSVDSSNKNKRPIVIQ